MRTGSNSNSILRSSRPTGGRLRAEELQRHLDDVARDPVGEMDRLPPKRDASGHLITAVETAFSPADLEGNRYVELRDRVRSRLHGQIDGRAVRVEDRVPGRAAIAGNDRPEQLVDRFELTKLREIDAAGLRTATLEVAPWADTYWPVYLGILGCRYADKAFPRSKEWKVNRDHVRAHPVQEILTKGGADALALLSPSEKYDLLIGAGKGEGEGPLTAAMWAEGAAYQKQEGKVETWMGICHGWAPASYMLPRASRMVEVKAADGHTVLRFTPRTSRRWPRSCGPTPPRTSA